jgi:hypothetical protein
MRIVDARTFARSPLVRDVVVPFVVTRLALLLVGYLSVCYLYKTNAAIHTTGRWWLYMWIRWDSSWYLQIMKGGYFYDPTHTTYSPVVFFPLYPVLARLLTFILPGTFVFRSALAALLVSNASALSASIYLYRLARLDENRRTSARAVRYRTSFATMWT